MTPEDPFLQECVFQASNSFVAEHADHDVMTEHVPLLTLVLWRALVLNAVYIAMPEGLEGREG